jgi:predicted ABC-class ATPase
MNAQLLNQKLSSIDGHDFGAYQSLSGTYTFDLFRLVIEHVPKDPFASPHTGVFRLQLNRNDSRVVDLDSGSATARIAACDWLARRFYRACQRYCRRNRGTGHSGIITISQPGQAILERNSVILSDQMIELRFFMGLPAQGRKIMAAVAQQMVFEELPAIVDDAVRRENINPELPRLHRETAEDAEYLREQLEVRGLIAFVADGAILPRLAGNSDAPMAIDKAVPFEAPGSMAIEIDLPHAGKVRGLGIRRGVTLITGGGYHGKSTLLSALEFGIYNHIPGDGRERCVTVTEAVKIRAANGRSVVGTDISPFIHNLPYQQDTGAFSTTNASGSTSQAASIMEAVEVGARVLLMDEDTCATNFIIRDAKMQQLVKREDEPIISFVDQVRQLYEKQGISTVMVLGGVGDYFAVSDQVLQVINYQPHDVTTRAHRIAAAFPGRRASESQPAFDSIRERIPLAASVDSRNVYGKHSAFANEIRRLNFGRQVIDLGDLEQLKELVQSKALAGAVEYARRYMDGRTTLREVIERVAADIEAKGLDILTSRASGHLAQFRPMELAFAINRLRGLKVTAG